MKKSVSITITDIDDLEAVLKSLDIFFKTIMLHYIDTNEDKFFDFIASVGISFIEIMKYFDIKPEDIDNG